jgi:HAD superfamily hydrolase (TIGR01509 family)
MVGRPYRIRAVLFDFDGTLTRPGALDFPAIREALGCPAGEPILEFIDSVRDDAERARLVAILDRFEAEAALVAEPAEGAEAIVHDLRAAGIPVGIVSRNSRSAIELSLRNFLGLKLDDFDVVASREVPGRPKPAPDAIHYAADCLGVDAREALVVGDHPLDVEAGSAAGAVTALLTSACVPRGGDPAPSLTTAWTASPDFEIGRLAEVSQIVRLGAPLPLGKFPNDLLHEYLKGIIADDPSLIIRPAVGEDVAAVDVSDEQVLVLKSDPITFVTESLGEYVVLVNANDIATSGASPRWLIATALFPADTTPSTVIHVLRDLADSCRRYDITLCGGHTEITEAVTRPVVIGTMAGTVERARLIDKRDIRSGDRVLLTKAVAVEGTAIIAGEFRDRLEALGMRPDEIDVCRSFLDHIGVLTEAAVARAHSGVTAMHDVTEGGLATALRELCAAGGYGVEVDVDTIPVFDQTATICRLLDLDPLGLIGSGSLLVCCRDRGHEALVAAIRAAGVDVTLIGRVTGPGQSVSAVRDGCVAEWPVFAVDELARLFQRESGGGMRAEGRGRRDAGDASS